MKRLILPLVVLMLATPLAAKTPEEVAAAALKAAPIWDGHNDVGEQLRERRRETEQHKRAGNCGEAQEGSHDRCPCH